ncbi:MAG: hypothetical protein CMJ83_04000 [Planctomycetes bacterium]|nr:hypothetical protein [Planctomycetota bacterium]
MSLRTLLTLAVLAGVFAPSASAQSRVDFASQIWPILEKNCVSCHRAAFRDDRDILRKPKAGLRLDGKNWILKGGRDEKVVIPGDPEDSLLYTLTTLQKSEDGFMPDKGGPLPKREQDLLKEWIQQGARFGEWTNAAGSEDTAAPVVPLDRLPTAIKRLHELGQGLAPASSGTIEKAARAAHARIVPAAPGSVLLRVTFASHENEVGDKQVAALAPLQNHITQLILGRTLVTDRAMMTVGRMKRLTRLDVRQTDVTDRGLARLAKLKELRYLNLFGTDVSDQGLAVIAKLENLESLFVWQTKVTKDAAAKLSQSRPTMKISVDLTLPETPAGNNGRRGRRGKKK